MKIQFFLMGLSQTRSKSFFCRLSSIFSGAPSVQLCFRAATNSFNLLIKSITVWPICHLLTWTHCLLVSSVNLSNHKFVSYLTAKLTCDRDSITFTALLFSAVSANSLISLKKDLCRTHLFLVIVNNVLMQGFLLMHFRLQPTTLGASVFPTVISEILLLGINSLKNFIEKRWQERSGKKQTKTATVCFMIAIILIAVFRFNLPQRYQIYLFLNAGFTYLYLLLFNRYKLFISYLLWIGAYSVLTKYKNQIRSVEQQSYIFTTLRCDS